MNIRKALTFDDLLIVPQYSTIKSIKSETDTSTSVGNIFMRTPIISAAMDTVTGIDMQRAMAKNGGRGIHHRYHNQMPIFIQSSKLGPIAVSPSSGMEFIEELIEFYDYNLPGYGYPIFAIDVAHGDREEVHQFVRDIKSLNDRIGVWSGNIVDAWAAERYANILNPKTDALKVGIGGGSACSTRVVSGCGYPQAQALMEISQEFGDFSIISDGGIKSSGDIVKALALGADAVIIGGLLAGTDETPGDVWSDSLGNDWKEYSGMASRKALERAGKTVRVEGVSGRVPYKGPVEHVINELVSGIKTGMAYVGARNIQVLQARAKFVQITQAGMVEGKPRIST